MASNKIKRKETRLFAVNGLSSPHFSAFQEVQLSNKLPQHRVCLSFVFHHFAERQRLYVGVKQLKSSGKWSKKRTTLDDDKSELISPHNSGNCQENCHSFRLRLTKFFFLFVAQFFKTFISSPSSTPAYTLTVLFKSRYRG